MERVQVVDPKKASYGVEDPIYAVVQMAQTTMRSELGKVCLHKSLYSLGLETKITCERYNEEECKFSIWVNFGTDQNYYAHLSLQYKCAA